MTKYNILYIDNSYYKYNKRIHLDFFKYLSNYHNVIYYGKNHHKEFKFGIKPFNPSHDFKSIIKQYRPDILISYNSNGSNPGKKNFERFRWCQKEISSLKIPKFHITTDYCRDKFFKSEEEWFYDLKYDCAIFRHKSSLDYPISIKKYWLPFSYDTSLFSKNIIKDISKKSKKIGFCGTYGIKLYSERNALIKFLDNKKLLVMPKKRLINNNYITFLTSNIANLTCGGTPNYFTAKYIEIPASYSLLVCSDTSGLNSLDKNSYLKYDKNNLDKFYDNYMNLVSNNKLLVRKIKEMNNFVYVKHSHNKRMRQLNKLIKEFVRK